jgi:D-alanyl-D-alanine carboxypeptidase
VLGGRSAGERDAHMRELINSHIREASLRRTAPAIAERMEARAEPRTPSSERSEQREPKPVAAAKASLSSRADPTPTGKTNGGTAVAGDPIQPLLVKTITYRTAPVQAAPLAPMPQLVAAAPLPRSPSMPLPTLPAAPAATPPTSAALPAPAPTTTQAAPAPAVEATATTTVARPAPAPAVEAVNTVVVASNEPAVIAPSTKMQTPGRSVIAKSDSARSEAPRAEAARPEGTRVEATKPEAAKTEVAKLEPAKPEAVKSEPAKSEPAKSEPAKPVAARTEIVKPEPSAAQIRARGGWIIQIGAFEAEEEAKQHLSEARLKIPHILASADPFTERVQKGDKALYRARFAGFDKANAEAACKQLKRSDIACMTVKN